MSEHDPKGKSELRRLAMGDFLCISGESPALARNPGNEASELLILAIPVFLRPDFGGGQVGVIQ